MPPNLTTPQLAALKETYPELADCIQNDGRLYSLGWYLAWAPGDKLAVLDGEFSPVALLQIAEYIKEFD